MIPLLVSTVDLARAQFATTSLYHFVFVPLTLGLAPLVAVMQTKWHRSGDEAWLRLTHFFGTLLLINFAIGVATGLVQEFQFGMNWSVYSKFVGNIFGAPLAIEGLVAFFLEATFLGLWIFGWDRLPPRIHLATIWLVALGTWLSAYFILVANSFMQHPVGYKVSNGVAELTSVQALLTNRFGYYAMGHTILAGLTTASVLVLGVACWHLGQGRNVDVFKRAAMLALVVAVPVSAVNLWFGSHFGIVTTSDQPMKIAAAEAQWDTKQPASFSLFQIGGFTQSDPTPDFSLEVPDLLSYLSTGSFHGKVDGLDQLQRQEQAKYGRGNYIPDVRAMYWSMRVMAYGGSFILLVAVVGAWLYRRGKLESARWYRRIAVGTIAVPFIVCLAGWILTEAGRQPWIVQGLLKTSDAASPSVGTGAIAFSLTVFVSLYVLLAVADFVLMRRYARIDPPPAGGPGGDQSPEPVMGY
ncbi:MAG: cytochrome ubiquinol oxidase subunit I [Gaiellales bacterium]